MNNLSLKLKFRQSYQFLMKLIRQEMKEDDLKRSAIIFSPHQDDETLGCGGTILRKKKAGANLKIVFMTDGSLSHAHLLPEAELKSMRCQEALAAAEILGVEEKDVIFLNFKDGTLSDQEALAVEKVAELLERFQPEEIFIPYYQETPLDHSATNQVVLSALKKLSLRTMIYEYPIWFWRHWPWTSFVGSKQEKLSVLKSSAIAVFGLRLLKNFRYAVNIQEVLDIKRHALNQHKSQMTPILPNVHWPTLAEVANGEFLDCFFQEFEVFRGYKWQPKTLMKQP